MSFMSNISLSNTDMYDHIKDVKFIESTGDLAYDSLMRLLVDLFFDYKLDENELKSASCTKPVHDNKYKSKGISYSNIESYRHA